jgi:hypothetical protein
MEKNVTAKPSVVEQVKIAMDGRTSRWLSIRTFIPETALSNKLNGRAEFTDEELEAIGQVLGVKIKKN